MSVKIGVSLMDNYGYIYETKNTKNRMFYIGMSKGKFTSRYHGSGLYLQRAIDKYGESSFRTRQIDQARSKSELNKNKQQSRPLK